MMLLYHLHNPTEPAFVTTCNVCDNDIKTGQGWRCKECDYDECTACYQENGGINHVHRLTKYSVGADRDIQNIQQNRVQLVSSNA
jgi:E1A/CREB-binding protein